MTHYVGLVMLPPQASSEFDEGAIVEQTKALLAPFGRKATVPKYVYRDARNNVPAFAVPATLGPTGAAAPVATDEVLFAENSQNYIAKTTAPFPNFDKYEIGGQFSGVLHPSIDSSVPKIPGKLQSVEYNTIKCSAFAKNFCPHILVDKDGEWFDNPSGLPIYGSDKYQRRIFRLIDSNPDNLLVLIDFTTETDTANNSLLGLYRR